MNVVRRASLRTAIVLLLVDIAGCGSSTTLTTHTASPAVVATTPTASAGVLPFTQPSAADKGFAARLDTRCRAIVLTVRRLAQPGTLSDQASISDREKRALMRFSAAVTPLSPPADLAQVMRSYRRALLTVITSDGFVVDAAKARHGEAVAYWLSQRAAAIDAMKRSSDLLGASACLP